MSIAGGIDRAPERARRAGADALQVFTATPRRRAVASPSPEAVEAFRAARRRLGIRVAAAHEGYLINLATDDEELYRRSVEAFRAELARARDLGLDFLVAHPGNATGGDAPAALARNAAAVAGALAACPDAPVVLFETTAGAGTALGARFEELARLLDLLPREAADRAGVCLDTAHVYAAGYDLRADAAGVLDELDRTVGLDRLRLLHCNDSRGALGSRRDRHAEIGEGEIGEGGFRGLLADPRIAAVPRILETPMGDDPEASIRRNLERLRRLGGRPAGPARPAGSACPR
ncbi:MAG: deoxyribonuclease IV [Gemmatimonadota bacterium]|nr:deoxyribonuclease IV [Gemmatimonadota bacterium]